jgi:hypothetical protein
MNVTGARLDAGSEIKSRLPTPSWRRRFRTSPSKKDTL